jgi:hypothetical protein
MIDVMKQAVEALENGKRVRACEGGTNYQPDLEEAAITALRQAIEEAEQWDTSDMAHRSGGLSIEPPDYVEPVTTDYHEGWEEGFKAGNALTPPKRPVKSYTGGEPQYATDAPKREWQGLTDEEVAAYSNMFNGIRLMKAIEALLKRRNT